MNATEQSDPAMPEDEGADDQVTFRLPKAEKIALHAAAKSLGVRASIVVRAAVRRTLADLNAGRGLNLNTCRPIGEVLDDLSRSPGGIAGEAARASRRAAAEGEAA